ncbi:hypothetical protein BH11ARM2_BH11ARM2_20460 [soil metagenome]
MEIVRYRPGEAVRWLRTEADALNKEARDHGRSAVQQGDFKHRIGQAAAAAAGMGKGAYTRLLHERTQASEYVLQEDRMDVVQPGKIKTIPYSSIKAIQMRGDRAIVVLEAGSMLIQPFAHLTAGRVKVPIGWSRNGTEVPFELLVEELAARAGVRLEES